MAQGLPWIEEGIEELRANGAVFPMLPLLLAKAEALHLADRTSEALEAVKEAEALVESSEARCWSAELHRLRGIFLAAIGADEAEIEDSFREAISTAKQQKSISLRNARKQPTQNIVAKKPARWQGTDCDYRLANSSTWRSFSSRGRIDRAMNTSSRSSPDDPDRQGDLDARERRTCRVCGARFSATRENESCPVCMLRKALAGGVESSASFSEDTGRPTSEHAASALRAL